MALLLLLHSFLPPSPSPLLLLQRGRSCRGRAAAAGGGGGGGGGGRTNYLALPALFRPRFARPPVKHFQKIPKFSLSSTSLSTSQAPLGTFQHPLRSALLCSYISTILKNNAYRFALILSYILKYLSYFDKRLEGISIILYINMLLKKSKSVLIRTITFKT